MTAIPFQRLLDAHAGDVHRYLLARVGPQDAEDCFQETFIAALRGWPSLRPGSNLRAWVLTIAHRKALDLHRDRVRHPDAVAEVPEPPAFSGTGPPAPDDDLWEAVRALPPRQRDAVVHRYINDLAYRDIASIMGCSEEAARRSASDGVQRLRLEWQP